MIVEATGLDYLIPTVRQLIGDTNPLQYRYLDGWIKSALVASLKTLQRWWGIRYVIDDLYTVSRFSGSVFTMDSPPVIMHGDEMPISLMAAYIIASGAMQESSWSVSSWRDAEIYVSNTEGAKLRDANLKRLWDMLLEYVKPPKARLSSGFRSSIPGADEYGTGTTS